MTACSTNPCCENGLCLDGVGNYICECAPGYTGRVCEKNKTSLVNVHLALVDFSIMKVL